jgi:hypothetical protein
MKKHVMILAALFKYQKEGKILDEFVLLKCCTNYLKLIPREAQL